MNGTLRINDLATTWRTWLVGGLFLLIYAPVIHDLILRWWDDPNYSHGFLVPLIAAWFIWRKRDKLTKLPIEFSSLGLVVMIAGMVLFVVANAGVEYFLVGVSMVITLFGLTLYLFGLPIIREVWFAFFLLFFMIPIPGVIYFSLTFPMQLFASKFSVGVMDALGMAVVRKGNIIVLPNQILEVAEACSGIRSLISLMAMAAIFGYLSQPRLWAKVVIFLLAVPIAIAGNIVRVLVTATLAYVFDIDTAAEPTHTIMGMSVFIVAFVLLGLALLILRRIAR